MAPWDLPTSAAHIFPKHEVDRLENESGYYPWSIRMKNAFSTAQMWSVIWRDICGPRREAVFFPQSTDEARRAREADGYNNAGRRWIPEECWENGTVLKRKDVNFDEYVPKEDTEIPKVYRQIGEIVKRKRESTSPGAIFSSGRDLPELADLAANRTHL